MTMFTTVLVANRGEIAVRVMRTLTRLGIRSVAIYSEADRDALHVAVADDAVLVGPADARRSYLDIERVVAAAVASGAQAIHPGYGFLSENADFAAACESAGIVFIGPTSDSIRMMGDKRGAKDAVAALGVPVVPGFHRDDADDDELGAQIELIGLPVIVKPAAGGGGKGMKVVRDASEIAASLSSARREALAAFGDGALLLEKYVAAARHVEVQVVGDGDGVVLHLGDRDCTLQRRHQKVVEEAPAPWLPDAVRERMRADSVAIGASVAYRGVGTVEFVVDALDPEQYYFLEMNTRLQVEHPVTEMVTGLDLVELQLRVAAGEGLPLGQDDVRLTGHAVEVRVYAEDGHHGFLPSSGTVLAYSEPLGVRVDSGIVDGDTISTNYDPLLLKVIAHADTRDAAFDRLDAALSSTSVLGLAHNVGVLRTLLSDPTVRQGPMTTSLIADLGLGDAPPEPDAHRAVAAALVLCARREQGAGGSPWTSAVGWRVGAQAPVTITVADDDQRETVVAVTGVSSDCLVVIDGDSALPAACARSKDGSVVTVTLGGLTRRFTAVVDDRGRDQVVWLGEGGDSWSYRRVRRTVIHREGDIADVDGDIRSPMPGAVILLPKAAGEAVHEGEVVAVVEAMKMEYPLIAPFSGVVEAVLVSPGTQVTRGQVLVRLTPEESS